VLNKQAQELRIMDESLN